MSKKWIRIRECNAMSMTLLLPWFPILLGVGVGGRLLGRSRGLGLGALCALFWITLCQASLGITMWGSGATVLTLIAGSIAMIAMGGWAGDQPKPRPVRPGDADAEATALAREPQTGPDARLADAIDRFNEWHALHRDETDPWPAFDEFLRGTLYDLCRATHTRPFRLSCEGHELEPLSGGDIGTPARRLPARKGLLGHVVTTGRAYLAGDGLQGELVEQLAAESDHPPIWCFAIREEGQRLGLVTVGVLEQPPVEQREWLRAVERLTNQFWTIVAASLRHRRALRDDAATGLLQRESFMSAGSQALSQSYTHGEPVALVVVAIEGLRALDDGGRWELADEVVCEMAREMRRKVRAEDCLGRFDGTRFVILLRRVDSELAALIVEQLTSRLGRICGDDQRWRAPLGVRCGVSGSGTDQPDLRTLLTRALALCHRGRAEKKTICSDLASQSRMETVGT